ncbi:single-stranded DNA-binding protein [Actinomycetaceae bacterium MB13-C1-2]|nr:single-stranded DNA-binding protein [Actinomycetaceae bacterium MB13-C1-2]
MSAKIIVTGNLGQDPELKNAGQGQVLELSIACTPGHWDKNSQQWVNDGADLWVKAPFWNKKAEQIDTLGLRKGARVTCEGTLMRRTYTTRDGSNGESLELIFPTFLGVIPKSGQQSTPQASYAAPASDPWGGTSPDFDADPPF